MTDYSPDFRTSTSSAYQASDTAAMAGQKSMKLPGLRQEAPDRFRADDLNRAYYASCPD